MLWEEIKKHYKSEWLLVEAFDARTEGDRRIVQQLTVLGTFGNKGDEALKQYLAMHKKYPERELYVVHSDRPELDIEERAWLGIRAVQ